MKIASAVFTANPGLASVTMTNGEVYTIDMSLPPDEQFRRMLADWLAGGNEIAPYVAPEQPVPDITKRQLRLWLVRNGVSLASVEAAIDAMPDPARTEALIEWQDASSYRWDHPLMIQIAPAFDLDDDAARKQAFRDAALL